MSRLSTGTAAAGYFAERSRFASSGGAAFAGPGASMNLTPSKFAAWGTAIGRVRAGSGAPARMYFIGDSTTEGTGAGSFAANFVQVLKPLLNAVYPTTDGMIFGLADDYADGRIAAGTGWTTTSLGTWGPASVGVSTKNFSAPTSASGNLAITFPHSFDRIRIAYAKNTTLGQFGVDVDGGSVLATVNTAGALGASKDTINCTAGTHTINLRPPTVGTVFPLGIEAYSSTVPACLLGNGGTGGSTTSSWTNTSAPYAFLSVFDVHQPDLTVIMLGINDAVAAVSGATFEANLTTIVTKAQLYGDVLILSTVPSSDATQAGREVGYITNAVNVATAKNCGFYDVNALFVNYATANAAGRMSDTFHPNAAGYSYLADNLAPALLALG